MTCKICGVAMSGRKRTYCSPDCSAEAKRQNARAAYLADPDAARARVATARARQDPADQRASREAWLARQPTVPCSACGTDTDKRAVVGRHVTCGATPCRSYVRNGRWPQSQVPGTHRSRSTPIPHDHPARLHPRTCEWCRQSYVTRYPQQKYCSRTCSGAHKERQRRPDFDRTPRECPRCGVTFSPIQPVQCYCGPRCAARQSKIRRRVRETNTFGDWRWSDFMRVAGKFGYRCAYCGEKPDRLDPDHVVPLSKGGPNILGNLLPTCNECNADKSAWSLTEWAASRHRRAKPARQTSWHPDDRRYWHLTVHA